MNRLKLIPDRAERLISGTNDSEPNKSVCLLLCSLMPKTNTAKISSHSLELYLINISPFNHILSVVCSSCFYHIRDLRPICRYLDMDSAELLANVLVSSRLDYCNSLLSGAVETDLTRLQRVQN